jgi:hypothetical protein
MAFYAERFMLEGRTQRYFLSGSTASKASLSIEDGVSTGEIGMDRDRDGRLICVQRTF